MGSLAVGASKFGGRYGSVPPGQVAARRKLGLGPGSLAVVPGAPPARNANGIPAPRSARSQVMSIQTGEDRAKVRGEGLRALDPRARAETRKVPCSWQTRLLHFGLRRPLCQRRGASLVPLTSGLVMVNSAILKAAGHKTATAYSTEA